MSLIHSIAAWRLKKRMHQVGLFKKNPIETQQEVLLHLLQDASRTEFGKAHKFRWIDSVSDFQQSIPVKTYEQFFPWIDRVMKGEKDILWPGITRWFSMSSGTTNDRSKFIPVTRESLHDCHFKCGKDMLALYFHNYPESKAFIGKALSIGGSQEMNPVNSAAWCGDLSAILIHNMPGFYERFRTPRKKTALLADWEEKIEKMAREVMHENVTTLVGVPTWTALLLKRVLELSGRESIHEVWPDYEVFFHGGIHFGPYKKTFDSLIHSPQARYCEIYNASEGFFALQDEPGEQGMLLMLDCGIFYEFIPLAELTNENPTAYTLDHVQLNTTYAMVITTNGGLWRYLIGDTVRFTSLYPFRICITGRTRSSINVFGEELMVENADAALSKTLQQCGGQIADYTVSPFFDPSGKAGHEWIIEYSQYPENQSNFALNLDEELKRVNADYSAKRSHDLVMQPLRLIVVPAGTFYQWLKQRNRLGGQNKIPRLCATRQYADEILAIAAARPRH